ncbi:peptidase dimerization domain-containing protein [Mesorhizobium sp. M1334]|uniref:peptidase dimerization domain-containing protein n=1 Tax=Mesorhizobium sp. M1334 TaxID=2957084 RepID=UPI00333DE302
MKIQSSIIGLARFGIAQVNGMYNQPGLDVGRFGICGGRISAAVYEFDILVKGRGGHAANPHRTIDPIVIAAHVIVGLQTLVSRNTDAPESLVISVTKLNAGQAYSIIPEHAEIAGTARTLTPALRDFAERQIEACAQGIAPGFGAEVEFRHPRLDPLMINHTDGSNRAVGHEVWSGLHPTTNLSRAWDWRISRTYLRRARAPTFYLAMARPLPCTIQNASLMTKPCLMASASCVNLQKRRWLSESI